MTVELFSEFLKDNNVYERGNGGGGGALLLMMMMMMTVAGEKKKSLSDLFRRPSSRLTVLDNQRGVLFINQSQSSPTSTPANKMSTPVLEVRTKNAVYCAIIFREFLKELTAISQEHLLVSTDTVDV